MALDQFDGKNRAEARSAKINIFVEPALPNAAFDNIRELQWVCRRSDDEDYRIERILRTANRQLRAWSSGSKAGITCVSINEHQDPMEIRGYVERKFADGQYTSTSGMILHRGARHEGLGRLGPVDLLSFIGNPAAAAPVGPVNLQSMGIAENLDESLPPGDTISCYCFARIEGRVQKVGGGALSMNPIARLPSMMFS